MSFKDYYDIADDFLVSLGIETPIQSFIRKSTIMDRLRSPKGEKCGEYTITTSLVCNPKTSSQGLAVGVCDNEKNGWYLELTNYEQIAENEWVKSDFPIATLRKINKGYLGECISLDETLEIKCPAKSSDTQYAYRESPGKYAAPVEPGLLFTLSVGGARLLSLSLDGIVYEDMLDQPFGCCSEVKDFNELKAKSPSAVAGKLRYHLAGCDGKYSDGDACIASEFFKKLTQRRMRALENNQRNIENRLAKYDSFAGLCERMEKDFASDERNTAIALALEKYDEAVREAARAGQILKEKPQVLWKKIGGSVGAPKWD